jgi:N-acetylmuramoyl-L-alanine amidase
MRNPSPPYSPTFDGTLSDFDIYPLAGFAVLRQNPLPAVLIEGSFFSHPHEERRLALTEFNAIEAWGIFIGIGKYFRAGIPALTLHSDSLTHDARTPLVIGVDPWTELDRRWIDARLDGREAPLTLNDSSQSITITPSQDLKSGPHTLTLAVKNRSGNSSWPFCKTITVMLAPAELHTVINPSILPPGGGATSRFVCTVQDSSGDPVADGTPVRVLAPPAGLDTVALTQKGKVVIYLTAPASEGAVTITASAGPRTITDSLIIRHGEIGYAGGVIQNRMNNATIGGATVSLIAGNAVEKIVDVTLEDGRYLIGDTLNDTLLLQVRRAGFFTVQRRLRDTLGGNANITLTPVASGVLHGRFYAIDPRFGGMETGDRSADGLTASRVNLAIARRLEELLTSGGATVSLIRSSDTTIAETERTKRSALLLRGMYIRIDAALPTIKTACEIYRNIQNQQLAEKILGALASSAGLDSSGVFRSSERFFNDIAMGTISVRLPSVSTGYFDQNKEQKIDRIAWGMFAGIVQQRGFDATHGSTYKVVDAGTGSPLPGVPVILDRTFTQLTDTAGTVTFFRLEQPDSNLLIPATHNAMLSKLP